MTPIDTPKIVYIVSDGTGITAEIFAQSLLTQFDNLKFQLKRMPFIDTPNKAEQLVQEINKESARTNQQAIVFSTLTNDQVSHILSRCQACYLPMFATFIAPLEKALGTASAHSVGRMHGRASSSAYARRIDAINYTLAHDDGLLEQGLENADLILIGVSRSGKTPTSIYLALNYGLRVANYPLIPEDFERSKLPIVLNQHRSKLYGLTITPERLHHIREKRRPNSDYAALANCRAEISAALMLMQNQRIPYLDSSHQSIEEIAARLLRECKWLPETLYNHGQIKR